MTNALQSVTNDINTVFGVSMMQYFPITPPFQGSRQCNGEEPIIWVMIGTILLTILREKGSSLDALSYLT